MIGSNMSDLKVAKSAVRDSAKTTERCLVQCRVKLSTLGDKVKLNLVYYI